jgi:hypothetical protein
MEHGTEMFYTGIYIQTSKKKNFVVNILKAPTNEATNHKVTTKAQQQLTKNLDTLIIPIYIYS